MNDNNRSQLNSEKDPVVRMLPLSALEEDPLNYEAFSMQELEALAADIQKDGFFGDIAAYPIGEEIYRIESGHRRYRAAALAGLTELPVLITSPPASMVERRLRLTQWNQNTRSFSPIDIAKLVEFTYHTLEMMKKQREVSGSLISLTADELGISTSNVSKYKMLLSLVEPLQNLAASGRYSWAHLAAASQLSPEGQNQLYFNIINEEKIHPITGAWLSKEIEEYRHIRSYSSTQEQTPANRRSIQKSSRLTGEKSLPEKRNEVSSSRDIRSWLYASSKEDHSSDMFTADSAKNISQRENSINNPAHRDSGFDSETTALQSKKPRHRRCDGTKGVRRAAGILRDALSEDALIKEKDIDEVVMMLHEMQDLMKQAEMRLREKTYG